MEIREADHEMIPIRGVALERAGDDQDATDWSKHRKYPRYELVLPVTVRVIVEEETFSPFRYAGKTQNVSLGGMLVEIEPPTEEHYRLLIRRQRLVRIHIHDLNNPVVLLGKIVWYDYHRRGSGNQCMFGIAFESLSPKDQECLQQVIIGNARAGAA